MLGEAPIYVEEFEAAVSVVGAESPKKVTKSVKDQSGQSREYWMWGSGNNLPKKIIEALDSNVLLPTVIDFKTDILNSGGLVYGIVRNENGREVIEPLQIPEIDAWLERSAIHQYLEESTQDLFTFGNIFPELLLNMRREIVAIHALDASECRLGKQDEKTGAIKKVHVSANWDKTSPEDETKVDALDQTYDVKGQILNGTKHKYVLPLRKLSRGVKYYTRSPLENLMNSGWLDVANSIPQWKKAVMNNQLSIKYHIQINEAWLRWKYKDWDDVDDNERNNRKKELASNFMKVMKGDDKAGGAHLSTFKQENGQEIVGWKIEPIKNERFAEGSYIEDATASDIHIVYSQGVDPTLMGIASRNGMSAGSGSDKRMALNQLILSLRPAQRKILMPLNLKASLENWHEKYATTKSDDGKEIKGRFAFQFMNFHIATLDQVNSKTTNPTE